MKKDNNKNGKPIDLFKVMAESMDSETLTSFVEYQEEHKEVCKEAGKKYLTLRYITIAFFLMAVTSFFSESILHWWIFGISTIMFLHLSSKTRKANDVYKMECKLFNMSERVIKEGRKSLYGG